jgi:hypothetical protein
MKVVSLSALHKAADTLRKYSWCSFLLEAESTAVHSAAGRFMSMTPSEIELETFNIVAQFLNQLLYHVSHFQPI